MDGGEDHLLVAAEPWAVCAETGEKLIRVQQSHGAEDAEKAASAAKQWREKRGDGRHVGPRGRGGQVRASGCARSSSER